MCAGNRFHMGIVFLSAWIYRRGVQLFTSAWHQPGRYYLWFRAGTYHGLVRGIFSGTAGGKSFSDHSSNWECGGECSGFSVSCSVVWKSCRAFFGREPCNLVQKELASDDRFLCAKHSPVFELFGFASMGWICAESVAALYTGLIGG